MRSTCNVTTHKVTILIFMPESALPMSFIYFSHEERHQESMRAFVETQLAACRGSERYLSQLAADLGKI